MVNFCFQPEAAGHSAANALFHRRQCELLGETDNLVYVSGDVHFNKLTKHPEGFFEVTSSVVARLEQGQTASSENFANLDFNAASTKVRSFGLSNGGQSKRII